MHVCSTLRSFPRSLPCFWKKYFFWFFALHIPFDLSTSFDRCPNFRWIWIILRMLLWCFVHSIWNFRFHQVNIMIWKKVTHRYQSNDKVISMSNNESNIYTNATQKLHHKQFTIEATVYVVPQEMNTGIKITLKIFTSPKPRDHTMQRYFSTKQEDHTMPQ